MILGWNGGWGVGGVNNVPLEIHLHDDLFLLIASTVPCHIHFSFHSISFHVIHFMYCFIHFSFHFISFHFISLFHSSIQSVHFISFQFNLVQFISFHFIHFIHFIPFHFI